MENLFYKHQNYVDSEIGCTCAYIRDNNTKFRLHSHDYYEIFLAVCPGIIHLINGKHVNLYDGTLVFIRPNDVHTYAYTGKKSYDVVNLTFTAETVESLFNYLSSDFPSVSMKESHMPPFVLLNEVDKKKLFHQMLRLYYINSQDKKSLKIYARSLLADVLTKYFSNIDKSDEDDIPCWLENLISEMEKKDNFSAGFARMVELSGKSAEHISRCFKNHLGRTATDYINMLRLNYAANMLAYSNTPIIDICFESGFGNIAWFYETFRKKYGVTPRKFREDLKKDLPV